MRILGMVLHDTELFLVRNQIFLSGTTITSYWESEWTKSQNTKQAVKLGCDHWNDI